MKQIYFIRHSIRDISYKHDESAPLTEDGVKLALDLVEIFKNKEIVQIYSSPFKRALDTVKPIAEDKGLKIEIVENFYERTVGDWIDNFSEFAERQWKDFDYKLENGESLNEVKQRIVPAFEDLINKCEGGLIICGHGTSFSVLFNHLTDGTFGYEDFCEMNMPDVFVYEIGETTVNKYL
ncbi:histidine phosphatase family protein [Macrococcoides caseolyticum]|uniref:histidine phosphatase family protein n=1 Tax=Macrococcoides caseolyticum TaxID=69966 RepID=UPI001F2CB81E|nr:histidine phosphatase family protein [Macrococcus caseolyticus]MCE4956281.1 histidine phosphatase family protein [Macrococcus caseolyticus]